MRTSCVTLCDTALQDLAVVVLLMLIPLLAPSETGNHGMAQIAKVSSSKTPATQCMCRLMR